jgi:aminotransferase
MYGAINLAQGFPDFSPPSLITKAATNAIKEDYNQYEITFGSVELRSVLAEKLLEFNGIKIDPEENITITCGSTEAMLDAIVALTDSGDEVIIPEPFYENYVPATIISGAKARHIRLREPRYEFDEEELKNTFNSRTKAIIINTPNNPTGRVLTKKELKLVADLCEDNDVIAITDEIYERIVYDNHRHISLATIGNMNERTVTISGISKTFSVTGWRVGYAVAERRLTEAIRKVHDFNTVCAPAPFQKAAVHALTMSSSYYRDLIRSYERKRKLMIDSLSNIGFKCVKPEGAYYILSDFTGFSDEDDFEFTKLLVKKAKVALLPASSFYSNRGAGRKMVRFSYSKKDETLREAVSRLKLALN